MGASQFTVGGQTGFTFNSPVTLTFSFDPSKIPSGATLALYYYDNTAKQWVNAGGAVNWTSDTITCQTTTIAYEYAVMAEIPQPASLGFTDVSSSYWAYGAIMSLCSQGIVSGYPDGTFKPDNPITRAEFVSIMDKVLKLPAYSPQTPTFSDVSSSDWCYQSVETAVYAGIAKGYDDGTFRPGNDITRGD